MNSLSNYPPGVTGNEYAISGAEREWEAVATCPECDTTAVMHHEAHREFGLWVWCSNEKCPRSKDGFEGDPDYES